MCRQMSSNGQEELTGPDSGTPVCEGSKPEEKVQTWEHLGNEGQLESQELAASNGPRPEASQPVSFWEERVAVGSGTLHGQVRA